MKFSSAGMQQQVYQGEILRPQTSDIFIFQFHAQLRFHLNFNHVPLPLKVFLMTRLEHSQFINREKLFTQTFFLVTYEKHVSL